MRILPAVIAPLTLAAGLHSAAFHVSADETARIYGSISADEVAGVQYVQVCIENNPGIMGCRLIFDYPEESLEVLSAVNGEVTKSGMFLDNIGDSEGSFEILWNSTSDTSDDGTLAVLEVKQLTEEPYEIGISYSQADTFNESWEDVVLVCENISSEDKGTEDPSVIAAGLEEGAENRLLTEIYALDQEQTPGAVIESYLEENGDDSVTEENVSGLQEIFESSGLDPAYAEKLTEHELAEVYGKVYEDYSGKIAAAPKDVGYEPAVWIYASVPIAAAAAAGIIIVLHRRMKNREKQK